MNAPKVLVCCPTSDKKSYCDTDWFDMVRSLSYPNYEVFLADNSQGMEYFKKIQQHGFSAYHVNTINKPFGKVLADSHNACRDHAIKHKFDYMLHLESDVFPKTENIIQRLLKHQVPVATAPYHIGHGPSSRLALQVEAPEQLLGHYHFINHSLDEGSDLLFVDGKLKPVTAAALGCCLIHRSIFEATPFRYENGAKAYPDTFFFVDLFYKGIQVYADTSLICEHRNKESMEFMEIINK